MRLIWVALLVLVVGMMLGWPSGSSSETTDALTVAPTLNDKMDQREASERLEEKGVIQ